ncbi:MAG: DUF2934 domain-containing protein [Bacteroidales bacterium]|nr:DUF2934 domain-containing protein [Bacteroidales bacterium]
MKTSKTKVTSKAKKTSGVSGTVKRKSVTSVKSRVTEEKIRKKAQEIYNQRAKSGEQGNALDDWYKAEKILRGS